MRTKANYGWLDRFRIGAALLVIAIHTSPLATFHQGADFFLTRVLARIAVPFFFMVTGQFVVSGFLTAGEISSQKGALKLRRYLVKTSLLYLICIVLYLPIGIYAGHYEDLTVGKVLRMLLFDGTFYHLWYFPACILGIFVVYLMSRFLTLRSMTIVSAVLYVFGLMGDSYYGLVQKVPVLESVYEFIFRISSYTRNGLFLAPLFLVLGAWMAEAGRKQDKKQSSENLLFSCSLFALSFVLMTAEAFLLRYFKLQRHDSMYFALVPVMFFLYRILLGIPKKSSRRLRMTATWIYILHPAFIVVVRGIARPLGLTKLLVDNSLVHYLAVAALSVMAGFVTAWLQALLRNGRPAASEQRRIPTARSQGKKPPVHASESGDDAYTDESDPGRDASSAEYPDGADSDLAAEYSGDAEFLTEDFSGDVDIDPDADYFSDEELLTEDFSDDVDIDPAADYSSDEGLLTEDFSGDADFDPDADYSSGTDLPGEDSSAPTAKAPGAHPENAGKKPVKSVAERITQSRKDNPRESGCRPAASRAWIEVDSHALAHNVDVLRARLPQRCRLMPAVKADGYGHGAVLISRQLNLLGVDAFCVASIGEAVQLRQADIRGQILILGYTPPEDFPLLNRYQLIQTVIDYPYARLLDQAQADIRVHIGIDTGMHRLGIRCENIDDIKAVYELRHIVIDGLFTHLCASDSPLPEHKAFTRAQVKAFYQVVELLKKDGRPCPSLHLLASYGIMNLLKTPDGWTDAQEDQPKRFAERRLATAWQKLAADYVRPGIALYGLLSSEADTYPYKDVLQPVLSLKAKVTSLRPLYAGESAGYGIAFTAPQDMRIAAISIGYGDGLPRELSHGRGSVLIHGRRAPIIGRICMDQATVDVSDIPQVQPGDTAVIIGVSGEDEITAGQIADQCGTITNEILCRLGARLDRILV